MSPGQAGLYTNALKVCTGVVDPQLKAKVQKLEAAIRFAEDDLVAAQKAIDSCPPQEADTLVNSGCILFKVRFGTQRQRCYVGASHFHF